MKTIKSQCNSTATTDQSALEQNKTSTLKSEISINYAVKNFACLIKTFVTVFKNLSWMPFGLQLKCFPLLKQKSQQLS